MNKNYSIKRTVFITFSGLTLLMFLFYASLSIVIAFAVEDEVINQLLVTEANYLRSEYNKSLHTTGTQKKDILPRIYYMHLYQNLADLPPELAELIKESGSEKEIFTDSSEHFHYRTIMLDNGHPLYLLAEVSPFLVVSNMSGDILILTSLVLFFTLALSLWFTYLVSQRVILPIVELSSAIKLTDRHNAKSQHDVPVLPYFDAPDEIGHLSRTLTWSFTQLNNALKRETHFTRDVGHELRTPLTIMSNTLTVKKNSTLSDADQRVMQAQMEQIKNIIDVLMSLAREESIYTSRIHLRATFETCVLNLHHKLEAKGFSVVLAIKEDLYISTNEQLLVLLVGNLLENSLRYATSPQLTISADDSQIVFANTVTKPICHKALEPLVKQDDSKGIGQGLYLVKRIVEALNWRCVIENNKNECGDYLFKVVIYFD